MAIFHAEAKIISRGDGRSAVAAAAYRVGDKLKDERLGKTFDYTKKKGIDSTAILAPLNAPDWVHDREKLWNAVERAEKRHDAQLAREFDIALPIELSREEMKALAIAYTREQFVGRGMIADIAFHDLESSNPHFHVLLTMRDITPRGFGLKNRDWNARELLVRWREAWANHVNSALVKASHAETRIDHRSLAAQGITDRLPQIHLGPELHQSRKRAIATGNLQEFRDTYTLGDLYETIEEINRQIAGYKADIESLDRAITLGETARESERENGERTIDSVGRSDDASEPPTGSNRDADESRQKLQGLGEHPGNQGGQVGEVFGTVRPAGSFEDTTENDRESGLNSYRSAGRIEFDPTRGIELDMSGDPTNYPISERMEEAIGQKRSDDFSFLFWFVQLVFDLLQLFGRTSDSGGKTFQSPRYLIETSEDETEVKIQDRESREVIFHLMRTRVIVDRLSDRDVEILDDTRRLLLGQRQVDRCIHHFVNYLKTVNEYSHDNSDFRLEYDRSGQILTYRSKSAVGDSLIARWSGTAWLYVDGQLSPATERAIASKTDESTLVVALSRRSKQHPRPTRSGKREPESPDLEL
jgi:hypothetical protein